MIFGAVADNLARVRETIARVQAAEGLRQRVTIVAVTKGHAAEAVEAAWGAGLPDVGENRVQEALAKMAAVQSPVRWHLIGHLQTNKAKSVPGRFAMVHAIDSERVAEAVGRAAAHAGVTVPVLLQVNVAGEEQKSGCAPEAAGELLERVTGVAGVVVEGLMTMAPFTDDERVQRRAFGALRTLRDALATAARPLTELSMGMSGDYRMAVAEGATMIRLGTVLFGERPT
jgi:pyridoxal phosphate enzyme (YggS family)